jgi:hypothetical protein
MHNDYKWIYDTKPYLIADETDYYAVYKDHKQIAAFKTSQLALQYVLYMQASKT